MIRAALTIRRAGQVVTMLGCSPESPGFGAGCNLDEGSLWLAAYGVYRNRKTPEIITTVLNSFRK